jgi:triosephosphate isomerase
MIRKKLIAGNWKMNKTSADAVALAKDIVFAAGAQADVDVVICPPFTALEGVATAIDGSLVKMGAQNMHFEASGAFTGEISAPMLRALFATHVILGHSERRSLFAETDEFVNKKVLAALKHQLRPILCVGESLAEREAGATLKVVQTQIEGSLEGVSKELATNLVLAYEPVWAIGTGKTATPAMAQETHELIKSLLDVPVLYGGSVKPENAAELLTQPAVDGALVGGASLEIEAFAAVCRAGSLS